MAECKTVLADMENHQHLRSLTKKHRRDPLYSGLVVLSADKLMVVNYWGWNLRLHSCHDGMLLATSDKLQSQPCDVCVVDRNGTQVAATLDNGHIEILSIESIGQYASITRMRILDATTGFYNYQGVRALISEGKLVVSGGKWDEDTGKDWFYWGLVSLVDGQVGTNHKVCKYEVGGWSYLAISPDESTVYMSCEVDDESLGTGIYAFMVKNGRLKFVYSHPELNNPMGITVDLRGHIYICNNHPPCIYQLTERGILLTLYKTEMPTLPWAIFWEQQQGELYVTSFGNKSIWRFRPVWSEQQGIPLEIFNMDTKSIQLFQAALQDGKEKVHSLRIMVVGHFGVGKTTLIKRLLGDKVNISERRSTEGIDVHVHCCDVSLATHEWTHRKQDSEQDYQLQRLAKLMNDTQSEMDTVTDGEDVLNPPRREETPDDNKNVEDKEQGVIQPLGDRTADDNAGVHVIKEGTDTELLDCISPQQDFSQILSYTDSQQEKSSSDAVERKQFHSETSTMTTIKPGENVGRESDKIDPMREMLKLLHENKDKLQQDISKYASLTMWDFAGQYAFYTTHQTFLTRRAIYLLVSDVSGQSTDFTADECYFDIKGKMKCKVHDLIEVWLNSIHSCAPSIDAGIPPVIFVGTHVDQISQKPPTGTESETNTSTSETVESNLPTTITPETPTALTIHGILKKFYKQRKTKGAHAQPAVQPQTQRNPRFWERIRKKKRKQHPGEKMVDIADTGKRYRQEICERYFQEIRSYLRDKPTRFHLVDEDFAIDNTVVDSKLEDLKKKIVEVASRQPYWGEEIPARWLPLEQELMRLKAAGVKVISLSTVEKLNQAGAVPISTDELDLFLRFQHEIGIILYFSMDILKDKIVLDPQWMIDALKSLITAEMFVLRSTPAVSDMWFEFKESGKLFPELTDAIWTKENHPDMYDNKEHILLLMEQLNIIAKPMSFNEDGSEITVDDYFLAPCMLCEATPSEVICPEPHPLMKSSSVLCYLFTEKFLPSPIFHRLLAASITQWPIARKNVEKLIFCGCCVFQIDHAHRMTLYFREYVIFARVTKMSSEKENPDQNICIKVRQFISNNLSKIIGCLGSSLQFELYIQCPQSDGDNLETLFPVSELQTWKELPCYSHDKGHMVSSKEVLQSWFEDQDKASPITQEHINHFRLEIALRTICSEALRKILLIHVPAGYTDIYQAIKANKSNLTSKRQVKPGQYQNALLNKVQSKVIFPDPQGQHMGTVDQFDISLLYTLIRNVSSVSAPTTGWGYPPTDQPMRDTTLEANVERIRLYRNEISGHSVDGKCSQQEFEDYWQKINDVLCDVETAIGKHGFREALEKCRNQTIHN